MRSIIKATALASVLLMAAAPLHAQEALRSAYFLEGYTYRHELNPAFAPEYNFVSIPVLGGLYEGMASNVGISTFLYPMDGKLTTFMNPNVDANQFLGKLHKTNHLNEYLDVPIIAFGFNKWGGFNSFTLSSRTQANVALPKDLFTFMKLGMTSDETHYNFKNVAVDAYEIVELAFGHSRQILPELRAGAKFKVLLGGGNAHGCIDNMDVTLTNSRWTIDAHGSLALSGGSGLYLPTKGEAGVDLDKPEDADLLYWDDFKYNSFSMSGFGLALDLGVAYQLTPEIELSAALTDLGFMAWNHTIKGVTSSDPWVFDGFHDIPLSSDEPGYEDNKIGQQLSDLGDQFVNLVNFHRTEAKGSRVSGLGATFTLGGSIVMPFYNPLKGGILLTQRINGRYSWTEARFSANITPVKWFDAAISYGASTFGSSFGWVLNFHPKGFNFFVGADHQFFKINKQFLPVGNASMSINIGMNVTFGAKSQTALAAKLPKLFN